MSKQKNIAVVVGPEYEDVELTRPVDDLRNKGHAVTFIGAKSGETVKGKQGFSSVTIEKAASEVQAAAFDGMLIPGGHSPDNLRTNEAVVGLVRDFGATGRPIAAICHGPQLLIEAGLVEGRRMTSFDSVRTDLENAGARVVDEAVVVDGSLITSRVPDDLDAFDEALLTALAS